MMVYHACHEVVYLGPTKAKNGRICEYAGYRDHQKKKWRCSLSAYGVITTLLTYLLTR